MGRGDGMGVAVPWTNAGGHREFSTCGTDVLVSSHVEAWVTAGGRAVSLWALPRSCIEPLGPSFSGDGAYVRGESARGGSVRAHPARWSHGDPFRKRGRADR